VRKSARNGLTTTPAALVGVLHQQAFLFFHQQPTLNGRGLSTFDHLCHSPFLNNLPHHSQTIASVASHLYFKQAFKF
jgi:hypothetical protein